MNQPNVVPRINSRILSTSRNYLDLSATSESDCVHNKIVFSQCFAALPFFSVESYIFCFSCKWASLRYTTRMLSQAFGNEYLPHWEFCAKCLVCSWKPIYLQRRTNETAAMIFIDCFVFARNMKLNFNSFWIVYLQSCRKLRKTHFNLNSNSTECLEIAAFKITLVGFN